MSRKENIERKTEEMLAPIAEQIGVEIYDVEFVKEAGEWYLRAYIDREGGVDINTCVDVSRALSDELDKEDFIEEAYTLEVSSPGLGRTLKKDRHFQHSIGMEIDLKTFSPNQTLSRNDRIHKEKEIIEEKIRTLRLEGYRLPYHRADFVQLLGMVTDVWRNFENLRNQADSFVNGNVFFAQIWFLLDVIETYIKSMDEKSQLKVNYDTLVVQFRKAVNCISRFHKMMQSVNQQSMQAPNYEIQIHCDLEKFIVSYTEFARRFLTGHIYPYADDEVKSLHQYVLPICTVDSNIDSIEADPLFLLPYSKASSQKICQTNSERERLLLSINMPNIEVMGRLYHTLPILTICHSQISSHDNITCHT